MSNDLGLYHRILLIDRPWMHRTTTDAKYLQLLDAMINENFSRQPLYQLSFPAPLTPKRKYYSAIITNEAIAFLNSIHNSINSALIENEKKYHIQTILSKKLPALLHETEKIIASHNLFYSLIDDTSIDKNKRDDAFIIQFLKYRLIHLFREIQDQFSVYIQEDILTQEQINSIYFNEHYESLIETNPGWDSSSSKQIAIIESERKKFKVIKGDFRPGDHKGILSYQEIISDPENFAYVEEELYKVELINADYDFTKVHSEKQKLAAVYHVLKRKGYFNNRNFQKRKAIRDVDIRKFLDHRYDASLDPQFRKWKRNSDQLASYLKLFPWMNNLPHC